MPLEILKFPYLVQQEMMKMMNYPELLMLSLCSSKALLLVRSFKFNIHMVRYKIHANTIALFFETNNGDSLHPLSVFKACSQDAQDTFEVVMRGSKLNCSFSIEKSFLSIEDQGNLMVYAFSAEKMQEILVDHMNYLLKEEFSNRLIVTIDSRLKYIPKIKNLECIFIYGDEQIVEAERLEQLLSVNPNQKTLRISAEIDGVLGENSSIPHINWMHLHVRNNLLSQLLPRFTGDYLQILPEKCDDSVIIKFLQEWTSGRKYQNLRTLLLFSQRNSFSNPAIVLENFETMPWDPLRRPAHYESSRNRITFEKSMVKSAEVHKLLNILNTTSCGFSIIFNSYLIFLILTKSPKELSVYKYLLVFTSIFEMFYSLLEAYLVPIHYSFDTTDLVMISVKDKSLSRSFLLILNSIYWGFFGSTLSIYVVHFIYRYLAISKNKLMETFNSWKFLLWLTIRLVQNRKSEIPIFPIFRLFSENFSDGKFSDFFFRKIFPNGNFPNWFFGKFSEIVGKFSGKKRKIRFFEVLKKKAKHLVDGFDHQNSGPDN
ncbi:hypothetical protein CRE_12659 [Caenorhabditis remanei]|uniref:F-box domain-containing protein n=1 Tax=Caenorhabditis remanei TaxID=31234 RepID=E3M757_CAERE|nr:hypothetical protein CRE_12659 [Caenorhabditis remanei]